MQGEDSLGEAGDAGGRAAQLAEDAPGLQGGHGLVDEGAVGGVRMVRRLLAGGEGFPPFPVRCTDFYGVRAVMTAGWLSGVGVSKPFRSWAGRAVARGRFACAVRSPSTSR